LSVVSLTTTRHDGDIRPAKNLSRWLRRKHWPSSAATGRQVHETRIQIVPKLAKAVEYPGTDGFLTAEANQPVGIFTADCLPIFIADEKRGVIGTLHAGWRGVRAGILKKAVQIMRRQWGSRPADIQIWFGPCIQSCCFEVQWDVARYFPSVRKRWKDRWRVDLVQEMRRQVKRLGVRETRQKTLSACTMHSWRYFSFRLNKTQDRQISLMMRTER
jgi:polyphenol oxidase